MSRYTDLKHAARSYCIRQRFYTNGCRGRTDRPTYACWSTPVVVLLNSSERPGLAGFGYWKTSFNNGRGFSRVLYTPSTFRVVVGEDWTPLEIDCE